MTAKDLINTDQPPNTMGAGMIAEYKERRGLGRPTLYRPEFCEKVIEFGKEGYSIVEMATELGVVRQTLRDWCERHPDFLDAFAQACEEAHAYWARMGRQMALDRGFNSNHWQFVMRAYFGVGRDMDKPAEAEDQRLDKDDRVIEVEYRVVKAENRDRDEDPD